MVGYLTRALALVEKEIDDRAGNVVLSDISTKHGYPITFKSYLRVEISFMLGSVFISMVFLLVKYAI